MDSIYLQILVLLICVGVGALANRNKYSGKIQKTVFIILISTSLLALFFDDNSIRGYIRLVANGLALGWALTGKWGNKKNTNANLR